MPSFNDNDTTEYTPLIDPDDTDPSTVAETGFEAFMRNDHPMIATGRPSNSDARHGFYNKPERGLTSTLKSCGDDQLRYLVGSLKDDTTDQKAESFAIKASGSEGRRGASHWFKRVPQFTSFSQAETDKALGEDRPKFKPGFFTREDVMSEARERKLDLDIGLCSQARPQAASGSGQSAVCGPGSIDPRAYLGIF